LFYETFGLCSKIAVVTCIFMNERHGVLHCSLQPAATRPFPQVTLGRLTIIIRLRRDRSR